MDQDRLRPFVVGPLGPAQLACIRSWRRAGHEAGFIHLTDGRPLPLIAGAVDFYLALPTDSLNNATGVTAMTEFLARHRASGVTCLAYSLARRLHGLRDQIPGETALWLPAGEVIDRLESKAAQNRLAEEAGLALLPSAGVDRASCALAPEFFPAVLRPDDPATVAPAFKTRIVENAGALRAFVAGLERIDRPLIAQPFVRGRNLAVHGYRTASGESGHSGFAVERMLDGVTLTLTPSALPQALAQGCTAFADALGIVGVYHIEFLHDPETDRHYFMEINGRLGGTTGKVYRSGFDEPALIPYCYGSGPALVKHDVNTATATNKQALVKFLIRSAQGKTTVFDYPKGGFWRNLADLAPGFFLWRDEIFDWRDLRTTTAYFLQKIYGE